MELFDTLEAKILEVEKILTQDDLKITGLEDQKIGEWESGVNSIIFALKSLSAQGGGGKSRDEKFKSNMTMGGGGGDRGVGGSDVSMLKHSSSYVSDKR